MQKTEILSQFIESYPGSSFPTLGRMDSGSLLVIKMVGSGNGARSLIAEYLVNAICIKLGWPVPDVFFVAIPPGFPWTYGTDEFDDIVQRSMGLNLGIEYISEARRLDLAFVQGLDDEFKATVMAIDLFFGNLDRNQRSQNILAGKNGKVWIVDHGGALLFQALSPRHFKLCADHIFLSDEERLQKNIDAKMKQLLEFGEFESLLRDLPGEWLSKAMLSNEQLAKLWEAKINLGLPSRN